jgi:hypothetical protein
MSEGDMVDTVKPTIFDELEMAEDLKDYVNTSTDVKIAEAIKLKIFNYADTDVLVVKKKIASPTEILDVKAFDYEAAKETFTSFNK